MSTQQQQGIFRRAGVYLFGERTQRLRESSGSSHWLSYLLVIVQSTAVVLALGHQTIGLLFSGEPAIVAIAIMSLLLLVATVWAADLCLLATLRRLPALARNRQSWALAEHLLYLTFVLAVEGATLAIVLVVLDTDPLSLVSDRPIIPAIDWLFALLIGARVALVAWTSVQLWLVRQKLPPQWSTLILEARELIGGKAQAGMVGLNLERASIGQLFAAYAAMSRPPARIARWWNRGIIRREQLALAEEDRQRTAVVQALSTFDGRAAGAPPYNAQSDAPTRPPTGPGSPTVAPSEPAEGQGLRNPSRPRRAQVIRLPNPDAPARRRGAAQSGLRNPGSGRRVGESVEAKARAVWSAAPLQTDPVRQPRMGVPQLQVAADISRASAQKYAAKFATEDAAAAQQGEGQAAQ